MPENGLLERDREREALRAVVRAAPEAMGAVAVVEGPAGIGKTSLLREVERFAQEEGTTVLRARGGDMERDFAYGVVRQLLERTVRRMGAEQALDGAARLAAPVLNLEVEEEAGQEQAEREFTLCHGLYWLICNLAERRPLVLVVDDLHDVDPPSLRFLLYLTRRVQGLPVALVGATRAGASAADAEALAQLAADPGVRTIRPRGLRAAGVAMLVRGRLGEEPSAEFVDACADVTGGNPFLVEQLVTAAADEGLKPDATAAGRVRALVTTAAKRSVLIRLERESADVNALARAVAVLGDDVELRHAAQLAELDQATAASCADRLAELSLLRPGFPLGFLHPLLRSTVLAGMGPVVRALAHARAATVLEAAGAPAAAVAAHLLECDPAGDQRVVSFLCRAAAAALERGAADIAARQLRRALEEPPAESERGAVLAELGRASLLAGDAAAAAQALDESVALAADPQERVVRELLAFRAHFSVDGRLDPDEIMDIMGRIDSVSGAPSAETQALIGEVVAAATNLPQLLPELGGPLDDYEAAEGGTASERMILAAMSRVACHRGASAERAAGLAERALASRLLLAAEGAEAVSLFTALFTLIDADRLDLAEEHLGAAMDVARRRGSLLAYAALSGYRAVVAYQRGDVACADAEAVAAMDTGCLHGALVPIVAACLVRARLAAGDVAGAAAVVAPLGDAELPELVVFNHALAARAQVRFAQGEVEAAVAEMREVLRRTPMAVRYSRVLPWRQFAVPVLLAAGHHDEAAAVAEDDVAAAESWGTPGAIGAALATRARCMRPENRVEQLRRAIASLQASPARLDLAGAHLLLGETLTQLGQPDEARPWLSAATEIAQACGANALLGRAHEALTATGAPPRQLVFSARRTLTPGEQRVADLAAEGWSNRAIAEALFVTAKTVENQLGRAYSKLGIAGRAELAGALRGS